MAPTNALAELILPSGFLLASSLSSQLLPLLSPFSHVLPSRLGVPRSALVDHASLRASISLARRLGWRQVAVLADTEEVAVEVGREAKEGGVCVVANVLGGYSSEDLVDAEKVREGEIHQ